MSGLQDYNSSGGVGDSEGGERARHVRELSSLPMEPSLSSLLVDTRDGTADLTEAGPGGMWPVLAGDLPTEYVVGGTDDEAIDTCESLNFSGCRTPSFGSANGVGATHGGVQNVFEDPDKSEYPALDLPPTTPDQTLFL